MLQPDPTIDAIRDAFLSTIPEELAPETAPEVEAIADEPAAEVPVEVQPSEPATTGQAPEPDKPSEARAYRKLLDGEAKLRAERKAFEAERLEAKAILETKAKAKLDPIGHLMSLGLSDKEVLEAMQEAHARDLGNLAPPEVRAQLAARKAERVALETEAKVEARLRAEAESRAQAEGQRYVQQYQDGITHFVATSLAEYPQLSAVASAGKPVAQAMYQTAVEMAAANPNGPAPTYSDVAKQLNQQLLELASFVAPQPTAPVPPPTPSTAPAKPVLRNSSTQAQPAPATDIAPKTYKEYTEELRQRAFASHGIPRR